MKKAEVEIGGIYTAKISGNVVPVRITSNSPYGGWNGTNTTTGREVRIKTAAKLRRRCLLAKLRRGHVEAERIVVNTTEESPLMQQYRIAKERHPGMLLLFRMGDFHECYEEDAETVAKELRLVLTNRGTGQGIIGVVAFPHHALETNLRLLLQAGHRVSLCEPVE